MAIGAINRKDVRAAVYALVDAATGATRLSTRIALQQAPEGMEHAYYAVEEFTDNDADEPHRGRGIVPKSYELTLRLAFSLIRYAHDQDGARDAADDAIDALERALYQPSAQVAHHAEKLDVTRFSKTERLHESNEWLIYDITVEALAGLNLAA